jgi:hypothetical protein
VTLRERLLANSVVTDGGCREWTCACFPNGYGKITVGSRTDGTRAIVGVHRVAYREFVGPIPDGLGVLHTCDNRPCIEPSHFFLGTDLDNARDRAAKGRNGEAARRGCLNGAATLDDEAVMSIRVMAAMGVKQRDIADWFGVQAPAVSRIVRGLRWSHLPILGRA